MLGARGLGLLFEAECWWFRVGVEGLRLRIGVEGLGFGLRVQGWGLGFGV